MISDKTDKRKIYFNNSEIRGFENSQMFTKKIIRKPEMFNSIELAIFKAEFPQEDHQRTTLYILGRQSMDTVFLLYKKT